MSDGQKRTYLNGKKVWNKGIPHSEETKQKMREGQKKYLDSKKNAA